MKKIALLLAIGFFFLQSCSPVKNMNDFYEKYKDQAVSIPIPKSILQYAYKYGNKNDFIKHLKSAKVFIITDSNKHKLKTVLKDLDRSIHAENFEDIIRLNDNYNYIRISVLEENGYVKQIILGISSSKNIMVIESKTNLLRSEIEKSLENISDDDVEAIKSLLGD